MEILQWRFCPNRNHEGKEHAYGNRNRKIHGLLPVHCLDSISGGSSSGNIEPLCKKEIEEVYDDFETQDLKIESSVQEQQQEKEIKIVESHYDPEEAKPRLSCLSLATLAKFETFKRPEKPSQEDDHCCNTDTPLQLHCDEYIQNMGRVSFEQVCARKARGYVCEKQLLIYLDPSEMFHVHVSRLTQHAIDILELAASTARMPIDHFMIGKSHVRGKPGTLFNVQDPNSWSLTSGIAARWNSLYEKQGYSALVAMSCIEDNIARPISESPDTLCKEEYAFSLENAVMTSLTRNCPYGLGTCLNCLNRAGPVSSQSLASIVYIAFSFFSPRQEK
jgi:hypothetical protein